MRTNIVRTRGTTGRQRLTKGAGVLGMVGRRKKERRRLRWEDCVKKDLAGVGDEG